MHSGTPAAASAGLPGCPDFAHGAPGFFAYRPTLARLGRANGGLHHGLLGATLATGLGERRQRPDRLPAPVVEHSGVPVRGGTSLNPTQGFQTPAGGRLRPRHRGGTPFLSPPNLEGSSPGHPTSVSRGRPASSLGPGHLRQRGLSQSARGSS